MIRRIRPTGIGGLVARAYSTNANGGSVLRYGQEYQGQVVREQNDDVVVASEGGESHRRAGKLQRLHPWTALGKTTGDELVILPQKIAEHINSITLNYKPQELRQKVAQYYIDLARSDVHKPAVNRVETDVHLLGVFLQSYASAYNVLKEAQRRMGGEKEWRPKKVLDVGFGPATGILALNEIMGPEWIPEKKVSVVIGSQRMKRRAKELLRIQEPQPHAAEEDATNTATENEATQTVVTQSLPGYNSPKKYDLIIATHQLFRSDYHFPASVDDHTAHLLSLLEPDGVLVLIERGDPKGFESIARARQIMIRPEDHPSDVSKTPRVWKGGRKVVNESSSSMTVPYQVKVLAPCAHHGKCPLSVGMDLRSKARSGFFNWCKFGQMVQRPKYMIELKKGQYLASRWDEDNPGRGPGGKWLAGSGRPGGRSYETATHAYLIIQRSDNGPTDSVSHSDSWARVLRSPMKRDKHVIMEVCSPTSEVEQWTVTKGFDRQAYHDARKATGGDLWALSAKNFQARGGNRKSLAKSEKVELKNQKKQQVQEQKELEQELTEAAQLEEDIIYNAWESNRTPGEDPTDESADNLQEYFDEMEQELYNSSRYQRQVAKERKAEHWEKRKSKW